jgi:anti-sigma factor RsiW
MPLSDDERADLTAYLDGELDDESTQELEAKLSRDPEARTELDALRQAWGMLDFLPKAAPSADFTHRTMERLSLEKLATGRSTAKLPVAPRRFPWLVPLGWAAAALLAAGAGTAVAPLLWRPAPDPDEPLVRHLRVVEKLPYYEHVEDLDFLRRLADPDLFGDEAGT